MHRRNSTPINTYDHVKNIDLIDGHEVYSNVKYEKIQKIDGSSEYTGIVNIKLKYLHSRKEIKLEKPLPDPVTVANLTNEILIIEGSFTGKRGFKLPNGKINTQMINVLEIDLNIDLKSFHDNGIKLLKYEIKNGPRPLFTEDEESDKKELVIIDKYCDIIIPPLLTSP